MKATITDIDQRLSMETGKLTTFVVIRLPSGKELRAPIDEATMQEIIAEGSKSPYEPTPRDPNVDAGSSSEVFVHENFETPEYGYTEASALSDVVFIDVEGTNGPPATPVEEVDQYEHHVESGVVEWEKLPDTQLPPQMKQILKASKINAVISIADLDLLKAQIIERLSKTTKTGQVNWNQGPRREQVSRPRRTVPMDEAGNPRPPGGIAEQDPGEVQDDDDGVAQA